jgi:hypothetical protein
MERDAGRARMVGGVIFVPEGMFVFGSRRILLGYHADTRFERVCLRVGVVPLSRVE